MFKRLVCYSLLLAATACASANRNATGSATPSVIVKNESTTMIELYVDEGPGGEKSRQLTKLGPGETYSYRGPVPPSLQHNLAFSAIPDIGTIRRDLACNWTTAAGPTGRVTCK